MKSTPFIVAAMALLLVGCPSEKAEEFGQRIEEQIDFDPDEPAPEQPVEPRVEAGHTAAVVIEDTNIGIESELEPGLTLFTVRNNGTIQHSLVIAGEGNTYRLPSALEPGETGTLEANLEPGEYRVYDPLNQTFVIDVTVREPGI
jgi:hypothetical protein